MKCPCVFVPYSEVFGMADFYKKAQAELESCKTALDANCSSLSDKPVLDGDVITMAIKFERLVLNNNKEKKVKNCCYFHVQGIYTVNSLK